MITYKAQSPFPEDGFIASDNPYDGLYIDVMGEYSAATYVPATFNEVCISITAKQKHVYGGTGPATLHNAFADVLRLEFDDTAVDRSGDKTAQSISQTQADQVAAFVNANLHRSRLIIHCFAGMSRSRSMAAAIVEHLDIPFKFTVMNEHVFREVLRALRMTELSELGETPLTVEW